MTNLQIGSNSGWRASPNSNIHYGVSFWLDSSLQTELQCLTQGRGHGLRNCNSKLLETLW